MDPVLAYIDPGAGSLLIQLLIGGLAGLAALIKFRWQRIRALFSKKPQEDSNV
jgi:hypothetical protein